MDSTEINTKKKLILKSVETFIVLIAFVFAVATSLGWFTSNKKTTAGGMGVKAYSTGVDFSDEITVQRVLKSEDSERIDNNVYRKYSEGEYYKYENGAYVTESGAMVPISFNGLLPGEYMEFTVILVKKGTAEDCYYNVGLSGITDYDVTYKDDAENTYSALGIYRESAIQSGAEYENGVTAPKKWFADYTAGTKQSSVYIAEKSKWSENEGTDGNVTLKFRITIDLEQYKKLTVSKTNVLSELEIGIGDLYVTAW